MEGVNYLRGLRRSWWLIVIVVLAAGSGGYLFYRHATPYYQSTLRLVIATKNSSTDEVSAAALTEAQAQALAEVAGTQPGVAAAVRKAGYPGAQPVVDANATSTQPFVNITVTDTNPRRAQAIANAYAVTVTPTKVRLEGRNSVPYVVTKLGNANLPSAPYSPSKKRDVGLGLAIGFVLGLALALLRESLNRSVRDSDELHRLTGLPVLGTVPRDLPKVALPSRSHPRSPRAEAYRQVRTTLLNASDTRPLTVAITSATTGDGKTSVATNVAASLSRAGHRVALVDADLRRPRVADFFELGRPPGLTEVLSGTVGLDEALLLQDDGRLAVLVAGSIPANPSEALGGAAMERVLRTLAEHYEFVLVDTPPVLPVTDAVVLAPKVDGVIVVARLSRTTRGRVTQAISIMNRVRPTLFGVVANQAGRSGEREYGYTYRYAERGRRRSEDDAVDIDVSGNSPTAARSRSFGPSVGAHALHLARVEPTPEVVVEDQDGPAETPFGRDGSDG